MEIKGGKDISNIHNRIGEAEKSHRSAVALGYNELWTILGADVDIAKAKEESPTTTRFFSLARLRDPRSEERKSFYAQLQSILGIKSPEATPS